MNQFSLEALQKRHEKLLKLNESVEISKADIRQIELFVKDLAASGSYIEDPEQRYLLRAYLRYWASFVDDKTGSVPAYQLQPYDISYALHHVEQAWKAQDQPWRTEPEIDAERQKYLAERRNITPDIEYGIYPFKDIQLSRADMEWLLAMHESGGIFGPVDWNDESQRQREGLDLRGANLRQANLSGLPLARIRGGLTVEESLVATGEQRDRAALLANEAYLTEAQGAYFTGAQLQEANFAGAQLQKADLTGAQLQEANLSWAQLQKADLTGAQLQEANFRGAELEEVNLSWAQLQGAHLTEAQLDGTNLADIELSDTKGIGPQLVDVQWGNTNLSVVDWSQVKRLGDEHLAQQKTDRDGQTKKKIVILRECRDAVRANRQLAIVLRDQGLNEEADHFAYRAQQLQRKVLWRQHEFGRWLFSMLLALLSGYGYRLWRILAAYIVMVSLFALAYFVLGMHYSPHLPLDQAYLESITAFHGRVFFEQFSPSTPQIWLTALEAIAGLIIEGVFIAMLIQRFFGK